MVMSVGGGCCGVGGGCGCGGLCCVSNPFRRFPGMYNLQLVLGLGVRRGRWCVCVCGSEGGSVVVVDLGVVVTCCWFGLLRLDRVRFSVGTSLFDSPSVGSIVFGMDSRRSCTRRGGVVLDEEELYSRRSCTRRVGAGQQQRQQSPLNYNFSRYPASPSAPY
jgi:hypothetical protein